ncbi:electron transfer flavoprotein beta subunit/FixA family protein [Candidatus Marinimicrobia bacterium MT.SAG.3]|nr:electron transfer flavoprotein beta subunit/FixA family protein [Candidatus Marinimicrobia bacterium MT.SAG.3]
MNIVVCMKSVPSSETKVKINSDGVTIEQTDVVFEINPYDEYAIEEAIRAKEAHGGKVTILTLGAATATQNIRKALAMGADEALHLICENTELADSSAIAELLYSAIKEIEFDVIFCGKKAIDCDNHQLPNRLAQLLDIPAVTAISNLELTTESGSAKRNIEGGTELISVNLPALFSAEKGLNEPRYASLPGIMAAKKKPLEERQVSLSNEKSTVLSLELPPPKPKGRIVGEGPEAAGELVRILREEAKVI